MTIVEPDNFVYFSLHQKKAIDRRFLFISRFRAKRTFRNSVFAQTPLSSYDSCAALFLDPLVVLRCTGGDDSAAAAPAAGVKVDIFQAKVRPAACGVGVSEATANFGKATIYESLRSHIAFQPPPIFLLSPLVFYFY